MDRQRKAECASLADLAFCPASAAVTLHNSFGDVETESNPSSIIRGHLKKPHEHGLQLVRRNADPSVTDREANLVSDAFHVNDNPPLRRRELDGIAEKIGQHLKNPRGIKCRH